MDHDIPRIVSLNGAGPKANGQPVANAPLASTIQTVSTQSKLEEAFKKFVLVREQDDSKLYEQAEECLLGISFYPRHVEQLIFSSQVFGVEQNFSRKQKMFLSALANKCLIGNEPEKFTSLVQTLADFGVENKNYSKPGSSVSDSSLFFQDYVPKMAYRLKDFLEADLSSKKPFMLYAKALWFSEDLHPTPQQLQEFVDILHKFSFHKKFKERAGFFVSALISSTTSVIDFSDEHKPEISLSFEKVIGLNYMCYANTRKIEVSGVFGNYFASENRGQIFFKGVCMDHACYKMSKGLVVIEGVAGNFLAYNLLGGTVEALGSTGKNACHSMSKGAVKFYSKVDFTTLGTKMSGGKIFLNTNEALSAVPFLGHAKGDVYFNHVLVFRKGNRVIG